MSLLHLQLGVLIIMVVSSTSTELGILIIMVVSSTSTELGVLISIVVSSTSTELGVLIIMVVSSTSTELGVLITMVVSSTSAELRSCVKVEVAVLGSPPLVVFCCLSLFLQPKKTIFVESACVSSHWWVHFPRSVLIVFFIMVSVDVKQH